MLHEKEPVVRHVAGILGELASAMPPIDIHLASRLRNSRHVFTQLIGKCLTPTSVASLLPVLVILKHSVRAVLAHANRMIPMYSEGYFAVSPLIVVIHQFLRNGRQP